MNQTVFFNTQHSPIGAFASFTLGAKGARGGLGVELGKPADQNIYIGVEDNDGPAFSCLPFFETTDDERASFEVGAESGQSDSRLRPFPENAITRQLTPGRDTWRAGDMEFSIFTPVCTAPDPIKTDAALQMLAYVPSLVVEIVVDNQKGTKPRKCFFGFQGNDPTRVMRVLQPGQGQAFAGFGCGAVGIASDSPGVHVAMAFTPDDALAETNPSNQKWGLGTMGLLVGIAPAGARETFRFAVCFHKSGIVTTGMEASYYYTKFFPNIESVADYSLRNFEALKARGAAFDDRVARSGLNAARQFMLAQAIHSYYGSTELLAVGDEPMWVVNEGEYRMMNTFDLTADQVFFEMDLNPWTVANELDWFVKRYSYVDQVLLHGDTQKHPGGIAFTHDMGVANHFSPAGQSAYEKAGLEGCFSHMTHEELVNWLMCGLVYEHGSCDTAWLQRSLPTFTACLDSLLQRDNPDPMKRNGIMSLDSDRCEGGSEITTYDSLDVSLGQARHNLYLAVRCWGIYVGLAALFRRVGDLERASICETQARVGAATIVSSANAEGYMPAVLFEDVESRIIPAVEGLVLPHYLGLQDTFTPEGPYGALILALKKHLQMVLQPGICLFLDGGWKISSTSENSWLSKVYLSQFITERVLSLDLGETMTRADEAHADWLLDSKNSYWAWSDQIFSGEAKGSKYYPRGVTSILWLS